VQLSLLPLAQLLHLLIQELHHRLQARHLLVVLLFRLRQLLDLVMVLLQVSVSVFLGLLQLGLPPPLLGTVQVLGLLQQRCLVRQVGLSCVELLAQLLSSGDCLRALHQILLEIILVFLLPDPCLLQPTEAVAVTAVQLGVQLEVLVLELSELLFLGLELRCQLGELSLRLDQLQGMDALVGQELHDVVLLLRVHQSVVSVLERPLGLPALLDEVADLDVLLFDSLLGPLQLGLQLRGLRPQRLVLLLVAFGTLDQRGAKGALPLACGSITAALAGDNLRDQSSLPGDLEDWLEGAYGPFNPGLRGLWPLIRKPRRKATLLAEHRRLRGKEPGFGPRHLWVHGVCAEEQRLVLGMLRVVAYSRNAALHPG
jgi:hypothetical protein